MRAGLPESQMRRRLTFGITLLFALAALLLPPWLAPLFFGESDADCTFEYAAGQFNIFGAVEEILTTAAARLNDAEPAADEILLWSDMPTASPGTRASPGKSVRVGTRISPQLVHRKYKLHS